MLPLEAGGVQCNGPRMLLQGLPLQYLATSGIMLIDPYSENGHVRIHRPALFLPYNRRSVMLFAD